MSPPLPPALAAFLRGIEPRARVLARAQAGPALDDEALLTAVRDEFVARAERLAVAEWPLRYWGLLLARDELSRPAGPTPAHPLYRLAHTRRIALLLRLVVGLEPAGAAKVLGLSETAYRALWADAEDKLAELDVGPAVLMRWHEGFQREVRAAGAAPSPDPKTATAPRPLRTRARGGDRWTLSPLQWALGAIAIVLVGVLAATFLWPPGRTAASAEGRAAGAQSGGGASPSAAALDEAAPSGSRRDFDAEVVVDPDFSLLVAPADAPWRRGVAFLSWYTVERGAALPASAARAPLPIAPEWGALPAEARTLLAPVEAAWPALDGGMRALLLAQAETWQGLGTAQREALRVEFERWLARPALERAALRAAHAEWRALAEDERAALAESAQAFAALPAERQQALRGAFEALDPDTRGDWAQGPRFGRQLPGLRPLLLHLPAGDQAELVAALDALDPATRDALAARIAAMGTAERAALRGRALALPAEQRAAVLAEAAAPR